jgi:UDP-N-acetylmuramoyl-L-alanyl-D-glutamate--2,6-diaminopimelate ligase
VAIRSVQGQTAIEIDALQIDSRKVVPGTCFIAIKGAAIDGHAFINNAIEQGAVAIICAQLPVTMHTGIVYVEVEDTSIAAGMMAHHFFGDSYNEIVFGRCNRHQWKNHHRYVLFKLHSSLGYTCD